MLPVFAVIHTTVSITHTHMCSEHRFDVQIRRRRWIELLAPLLVIENEKCLPMVDASILGKWFIAIAWRGLHFFVFVSAPLVMGKIWPNEKINEKTSLWKWQSNAIHTISDFLSERIERNQTDVAVRQALKKNKYRLLNTYFGWKTTCMSRSTPRNQTRLVSYSQHTDAYLQSNNDR